MRKKVKDIYTEEGYKGLWLKICFAVDGDRDDVDMVYEIRVANFFKYLRHQSYKPTKNLDREQLVGIKNKKSPCGPDCKCKRNKKEESVK